MLFENSYSFEISYIYITCMVIGLKKLQIPKLTYYLKYDFGANKNANSYNSTFKIEVHMN